LIVAPKARSVHERHHKRKKTGARRHIKRGTTSEFAERKLRLSSVRANPTAFVHKLRILPNDRAILRKYEGINEQAIKFQPDGLFDSSFVVRVTVTTQ
jgi:hypothetical protein